MGPRCNRRYLWSLFSCWVILHFLNDSVGAAAVFHFEKLKQRPTMTKMCICAIGYIRSFSHWGMTFRNQTLSFVIFYCQCTVKQHIHPFNSHYEALPLIVNVSCCDAVKQQGAQSGKTRIYRCWVPRCWHGNLIVFDHVLIPGDRTKSGDLKGFWCRASHELPTKIWLNLVLLNDFTKAPENLFVWNVGCDSTDHRHSALNYSPLMIKFFFKTAINTGTS